MLLAQGFITASTTKTASLHGGCLLNNCYFTFIKVTKINWWRPPCPGSAQDQTIIISDTFLIHHPAMEWTPHDFNFPMSLIWAITWSSSFHANQSTVSEKNYVIEHTNQPMLWLNSSVWCATETYVEKWTHDDMQLYVNPPEQVHYNDEARMQVEKYCINNIQCTCFVWWTATVFC